jgi:hypothetical protein
MKIFSKKRKKVDFKRDRKNLKSVKIQDPMGYNKNFNWKSG